MKSENLNYEGIKKIWNSSYFVLHFISFSNNIRLSIFYTGSDPKLIIMPASANFGNIKMDYFD